MVLLQPLVAVEALLSTILPEHQVRKLQVTSISGERRDLCSQGAAWLGWILFVFIVSMGFAPRAGTRGGGVSLHRK